MLLTFNSWEDLIAYLDGHNTVFYQAPLDRYPVPVDVTRRFKNGKLRLNYRNGSFTADRGHLDRFRWKSIEPKVGP
jgi:hypothetical protein